MSLEKINPSDDDFIKQNDDKMDAAKLKKLVKENMYAGVTVALVSTVLSPALAMAQGATAMMGLTTGIFGPAIAGVLGGSHYNILGPAGALVNIVSNLSANYGVDIVPWVTLVSGLMAFVVFLVKFENYCTMLPASVLEGFSLGVATTIGMGQFNNALGLGNQKRLAPYKDFTLPKHKEFYMNVGETFQNIDQAVWKDFFCFLPFFAVLMTLLRWKPSVPWIVIIAALGVIYGVIMEEVVGNIKYTPVLLREIYPSLAQEVKLGQFGYWTPDPKKTFTLMNVIVGALKVAFVAVLETLISARIADNKTNTRFDQSKEIFGMSLANMACGLLGGVPCTGVLIRTNVNV